MVDCDWGKKNTDISGRYGVRGYPTVIFTDPKGEEVARMQSREASTIKGQIEDLAKRYRMKSKDDEPELKPVKLPFGESLDEALATGKKDGKPVLMVFGDDEADAIETATALLDETLTETLAQFVAVQHKIEKDCEVCKKHKARKGSLILVFDPRVEKPEENPITFIKGKRSVKSLGSSLSKALEKYKEQSF